MSCRRALAHAGGVTSAPHVAALPRALQLLLVALLPWGLAASRTAPHSRGRVRLLVGAAVCAAPPVLALVVGLDHRFWQAGLCG